MYRYKNDLVKKYVSDDPFPKGFKQLTQEQVEKQGGTWRICSACGKGFGAFKDKHGICSDCFNKRPKLTAQEQVEKQGGTWRICSACGKGFGAFKDEHTMCGDCFRSILRSCVRCGKEFPAFKDEHTMCGDCFHKQRPNRRSPAYKANTNSSGQRHYTPASQQSNLGEIAKKLFDSLF